jgi:ankyrin repeat protein
MIDSTVLSAPMKGGSMKIRRLACVVAIAFMAAAVCAIGADLLLQKDKDGALFKALQENDPAKVKAALAAGADPNAIDGLGDTPLWLAECKDSVYMAKALLGAGAEIDKPVMNSERDTVLLIAIREGKTDFARFLIESGADVNASNNSNAVPLHPAACHGNKEIVELLISKGADTDVKGTLASREAMSGANSTPLEKARRFKRAETAEILEKAGAKKQE